MLPAAAEVTGPVDRRPAQDPTPATEPEPVPTAVAEPVPAVLASTTPASETLTEPETEPVSATPAEPEVAPVPVAASSVDPEPADAPVEPEPVPATPATAATPAEPVTAADAPVEPEPTPANTPVEPVVVPVPRGEVAPATTGSEAADDDFRRIQGVGPKMAAALQAAGIRTYRQLAELDEAALRETIRAAGLRAAPSLTTWPQQAKVLAGAPQEASVALPTPVGRTDA
ncbi:hypothetical protein OIE14_26345 [Micromonospora peucetia]|uniref:Helix-hairpin-helix domain-containing protein n=1 Tax=Micromonospora peucetia TaxID=47871 RepID=A0ABZ1ENG1_9ACTN|nr:helix-hairpin-helix domain-containing protein [Micromonospora peucetia]WSA35833.1 hypothetical protein OIE14_26345 [Micromonospora peucetia]